MQLSMPLGPRSFGLNVNEGISRGQCNGKAERGREVSGPLGLDDPYHAAITKISIRLPWEICARLGYGRYGYSGQSQHLVQ